MNDINEQRFINTEGLYVRYHISDIYEDFSISDGRNVVYFSYEEVEDIVKALADFVKDVEKRSNVEEEEKEVLPL